jgi:hypothetical protein
MLLNNGGQRRMDQMKVIHMLTLICILEELFFIFLFLV